MSLSRHSSSSNKKRSKNRSKHKQNKSQSQHSKSWDSVEQPSVNLTPEVIKKAYRVMETSRYLDKKQLILLKQGKSFFHIGCMGHEAVQTAAAAALTPGRDWAYPYYRGLSLCLGLGMTPYEVLLSFLAKAEDPNSGGRQMPQHYGHKKLNIPSQSSPTGTQYLQSVGCALASMRNFKAENPTAAKLDYEVTIVSSGDGTTSQGDFHEALNWASRKKAPVIFMVEDNGYAISVPTRSQTADGDIAQIGEGYKNMHTVKVDGTDFIKSYAVMLEAVARARTGTGPTLIVANVVRLLPHSSSDDQRKYRPSEDLAKDLKRDPLIKMRELLKTECLMTEAEIDILDQELHQKVEDAANKAIAAPEPEKSEALKWVLSGEQEKSETTPNVSGDGIVLVDAINRALTEEMERDPKMLIFGEDVGQGKGGVFTATRNLTETFGEDRCFNSPLAESSIVGVAIGLAMRGYNIVPEIQFGDYIWTAMMQIRNELSTMRYRSNNKFTSPVVLRVPIGGYIHGALCHSQNIESFFAHIPGLKIALPSNALDAYGLLKSAIRGNDPVLFLEHKGLYRQNFAKSQLPTDTDWTLPFGKARIHQAGEDVTVITYGAMVQKASQASLHLKDDDISVEIVDLRTINPIDWQTIFSSVRKTGKVLVLHEDCRFSGFGGEIASEIAEHCFTDLDAPIKRLAAKDAPIPFASGLEDMVLPQIDDVVKAIRDLNNW